MGLYFYFCRALANVQAHLGTVPSAPTQAATTEESMEVDTNALPEEVDTKIATTGEE